MHGVSKQTWRENNYIVRQYSNNNNNNNNQEQTSTTATENQQDDNSSDAEVQQLLYDYRCFKEEIQEAIHDKDYDGINEVDPNREGKYRKEARSEAEVQQSLSDPQSF